MLVGAAQDGNEAIIIQRGRTTGTVDVLGLVGPLTHWSAYECVVFTEGPGSWRPVLLTAVDALGTQGECTQRVDQQTVGDDGKTARLRRSWTESQDTEQSQRQREQLEALRFAALQLAGGARNRVEGQPRSWGIDRDVCAFLAQAEREGTTTTRKIKG